MTTVEYDAKNKVLGRLASDIAITLRGKKTVAYRPDRLADIADRKISLRDGSVVEDNLLNSTPENANVEKSFVA